MCFTAIEAGASRENVINGKETQMDAMQYIAWSNALVRHWLGLIVIRQQN
jgi:hypothetical protein